MKQLKLWFHKYLELLAQKQINITSVVESKSNNGKNMNDVECKTSTFLGGELYLKCLRFTRLKQRVRTRI